MLLAIVVTAGFAGLRGLNAAYAKSDRDARTLAAMQQAKQALLGYAASQARLWGSSDAYPEYSRIPGALPCPARSVPPGDSEFGSARSTCVANSAFPELLVGRLPYRTLELPDLRDGSGEALWYAVSSGFRYQGDTTPPINLDSQGGIALVDAGGNVTQGRVVAAVIAPGAALATVNQTRATADMHTASAYLERYAVVGADYNLRLYGGRQNQAPFRGTAGDAPFNDTVITITEEELQDAIDTGVALRIQDTVVPLLLDHLAIWGTLPYATGSFNPGLSVDDLKHPPVAAGDPGRLYGQLPTAPLSYTDPDLPLKYGAATVGVPTATPAAVASCTTATSGATVTCSLSGGTPMSPAYFDISVPLRNVNAGVFGRARVTVPLGFSPSLVSFNPPTGSPVGDTLDGTVRVTGSITGNVQIRIGLPLQRLTSGATSLDPEWWFMRSEWPRFLYYARCSVAGSAACLGITDANGTAEAPARAALLYPGRAVVKSSAMPQNRVSPYATTEYFEPPHDAVPLSNAAAVPAFRRNMRRADFNDRVVAIR